MSKLRRVAIIDMGTNTFHLLIADLLNDSFNIINGDSIPVRIGKNGINRGFITPEAQDRALDTLSSFKKTIDSSGIESVYTFATSAVRSARNSKEFLKRIESKTGIKPRVISGKQEAQLIFKGVQAAINLENDRHLIVDIGGGSIEFIICDDRDILWDQSFEIGAQRLTDTYHVTDPIDSNNLKRLYEFFESQLKTLATALSDNNPSSLVGCSGTFDTLSDIYEIGHSLDSSRMKPQGKFDLDAFPSIFAELKSKNYNERLNIPGMIPIRAEMIVAATCLIDWLLNIHEFSKICISRYALKEGILQKLLNSEPV